MCVSFYKWTMRSVLKQEYLSGILILGKVVKRARMKSVMFYKAVGRGDWDGLKVVTIEIIEIVTTIIVTTFKRRNNLNML